MDNRNLELACGLVDEKYIQSGKEGGLGRHQKLIRILLSQRKIPDEGWSEHSITLFINELSCMDSNNFIGNVGLGEREGRVYSNIVSHRHFSLSHGIGRSGK